MSAGKLEAVAWMTRQADWHKDAYDLEDSEPFAKEGQTVEPLVRQSEADARIAEVRKAYAKSSEEVCQTLGKALGYPWFKDDPANFPDATEEHGVCVGDHVAESIADETAKRLLAAEAKVAELEARLGEIAKAREVFNEHAVPFCAGCLDVKAEDLAEAIDAAFLATVEKAGSPPPQSAGQDGGKDR